MAKLIINGEDAILGRLCTYIAKQALLGDEIVILNSEKVIVTGNKQNVIQKYTILRGLGGRAQKGPNYPSQPHMILKRAIRGMLPSHREGVGRDAFKRITCYEGIPREFEKEKIIKIKVSKPEKYITLKEISEKL
ncbi:50S ribosomal protein L13 [Candidatus Pacearchaeota archaeon]|nr:50S ribosomal protein L13 [Candidatus Pacearchaeota archaeon]